MKRFLIFIFLLISLTSIGQGGGKGMFRALLDNAGTITPPVGNTNFSFNEYPYSNTALQNPGMGAEQWHNGSQSVNYPTVDSLVQPWDEYYRFQWVDVEPEFQGVYSWTYFDNLMQESVNSGKQLSFGIMSVFSGQGKKSYDGRTSAYPEYLHNLMQAEANPDWGGPGGDWIPNYNSINYLGRLRALHAAINNHILTTSYTATTGPKNGQTIAGRDMIYCIDIRGYGQWGEWNTYGICNWSAFPSNRQPTIAALKEIIDTHTEEFTDFPLVMMVGAYDGGKTGVPIFALEPEVAWYALQAANAWGPSGWRRDQWGATDTYLNALLVGNDLTYNGSPPFNTVILTKYETSPITGEVYPGQANADNMVALESQVVTYGATSFGNGNWGGFPNPTAQVNIRASFKRTGYRLKITTGNAPTVITRSVAFNIVTNWANVGICPAYNNWVVQFELQNTVTSAVVWTGTSSKVLKRFRPNQGTVQTTDGLTVPGSVSAGTYKLVVRVRDQTNYRPNMKLSITQPQNADGSYTIFSTVTVN